MKPTVGMPTIFRFKCTYCSEAHEGAPSFAFIAPDQYAGLTVEQKASMGTLADDFCTITHSAGVDRFIRCVLEIPIHGSNEPVLWGIWVSLSEKSFTRYQETYGSPVKGNGFFGWVCNQIALYPCDRPRSADVYVQLDGQRPKVVLHRREAEDDELVNDQTRGISALRAQELAERAMHGTDV